MTAPVFVVLVNYNRWLDTVECIESVLRSDYPDVRVVLVDNGSQDGSVEKIVAWAKGELPYSKPGAPEPVVSFSWPPLPKPVRHTVLRGSQIDTALPDSMPALTILASDVNAGFSGGNNVAMRRLLEGRANGYVLLLNNDMVVSPSTVRALVEALSSKSDASVMGGVMLEYQQPTRVQMVGGGNYTALATSISVGAGLERGDIPENLELGYIGGGCLLMDIETLRLVGLLDERFFLYGEDIDWGLRMTKAGCRLRYTTKAEVWHKGSITMGKGSPFQDYHVVKAQLQFVHKHSPLLTPIALGYTLARSLAPKLVRRQWPRARAVTRAIRDYLAA